MLHSMPTTIKSARLNALSAPEIVALGHNRFPLSCATKTYSGTGLRTLQRWLGDGKADILLLHNGPEHPVREASGFVDEAKRYVPVEIPADRGEGRKGRRLGK
jgi:hypothetical protein